MQEDLITAEQKSRAPGLDGAQAIEVADRPWGSWALLYEAPRIKVKLIEVRPGHRLSLQYHRHRSEFWVCISGRANARIGDRSLELAPHDTAFIPTGALHRLGNSGQDPVVIVEMQRGDLLDEEDIVRLEDDYHRVTKTSSR